MTLCCMLVSIYICHFMTIIEPLEVYTGHTALVTCIIYQNEQLISASWDR